MQTYFMHYRRVNEYGDIDGKGGMTVAIRPTDTKLVIGLARCNPVDNFNKKMGRTIATGRATAAVNGRDLGKNSMIIDKPVDPEMSFKDLVDEVLQQEVMEFSLY